MGSAELMLFAGLIMAGASVYLFVSSLLAGKPGQSQLSWASGNEPVKSKNAIINITRPLVHQFTLQHTSRVKSVAYREKIAKLIKVGGLTSELNVDEFIGLQIFLGFALPVFLLIMNFALSLELPIIFLIGLGLIGFFLPQMHCKAMKKKRGLSVQVDMPFFIDLLALAVAAGADFFGAIQKIVDKVSDPNSVLAEELKIVLKDIKIGSSKADALKEMAARLDMPEITSFVAVLIDSEATGSSIGQVLKDQSEQMRLERFVRAEKAGAKASQMIMLPLILFIVPAVFIMVLGPLGISMMYGGK